METIFESCLYSTLLPLPIQTIVVYLHGKGDIKQKSRAISIKDCVVTVKEPRALPLLCILSWGIGLKHQAMGEQASEVVSITITWHPRAWSKTRGIASS